MAGGKYCPECGYVMYALSEEEEPGGVWILYECRDENCKFQEKVYEERELTYLYTDNNNDKNSSYGDSKRKHV